VDKDIIQQLYKSFYNEIYLYLYALCKNKDLAEDLTQETFVKAILSLANDHTNMRAWLYLVARNLYFNHRKKESRSVSIENIKDSLCCDSATEILENLIQNEKKRILYKGLYQLNDIKREILTMYYFSDLSQREIATLLKLTPENVRVLAFRAKRELKIYLEENGHELS